MNTPPSERTPQAMRRDSLPASPGVYLIRCAATDRVYVGASKSSVRARTNQHRRALVAGTHSNKAMQQDWATHGPEAFLFEVAELVPDAGELQAAENRIMELHAASCYNRKPSNMHKVPGAEKDLALYKVFHTWRIAFYARPLQAFDTHLLRTLQADLQRQLTDIGGELERRATPAPTKEEA